MLIIKLPGKRWVYCPVQTRSDCAKAFILSYLFWLKNYTPILEMEGFNLSVQTLLMLRILGVSLSY